MPRLHQVREIHAFLQSLAERRRSLMRATDVAQRVEQLLRAAPANPWIQFLLRMVEAWRIESDDAEMPAQDALEFFYETCAESRRDFSYGDGVILSTVHAAKGTEHDHVLLIGAWLLKPDRTGQEEERRAFYVGMTRARQTLVVFDPCAGRPSLPESLTGPAILRRDAARLAPLVTPPTMMNYVVLGLEDINLGYAGCFEEKHPIHAALANLKPGHCLTMRQDNRGLGLFNDPGICVAHLSRKAEVAWQNRLDNIREIRVLALVHRTAEQEKDPGHLDRCRVNGWEVPVVEVIFAGQSSAKSAS
jgi:ATP-dependent DNA helicase RecQ